MIYENKIDFDNIEIENLNISVRLKNVLLKNNIIYFSDLLKLSNEQIKKFKNIGVKSYEEVQYLKRNLSEIGKLIVSKEEKELSDFEKIQQLEKNIDKNFIDSNYSDLTYNDFNISIRLKNCLFLNKITSISSLLKTPIETIKNIPSLGNKSLQEVMNIKFKLLDINNFNNTKTILYLIIKKIANNDFKSVIYIKNYLVENTNYKIEFLLEDLNELKGENKIEISTNGIKVKKISIEDCIKCIEDENKKNIMTMRLNGATLDEIGTKEGVTRERIRQITTKFLMALPDVNESKYRDIYEKYDLKESEFCKIFNESKTTYYYLKLTYEQGKKNIIEGLDTTDFSEYQKSIIRELRNLILVNDECCQCSKVDVIKILSKKFAKEGMTFENITDKYNEFVNKNKKLKLDYADSRSVEGILGRMENIILDFGRKFRYLDFSILDKVTVENLKNIVDLEAGYYSTLVLFNNNSDLMKELDIRSEYELHSLLKKNQHLFLNLNFDRMPNFSIGEITKYDFTLNKIYEMSPISVGEFLEFLETNYGHKQNTFQSYLLVKFKKFIDGEFINSGVSMINDELIEKLKITFTEPLYSLDLVKEILKQNGYNKIEEIVTKKTLYKIGYKIRSSYIIKKEYDSVEEYYTELSKTTDFIPNENIIDNSTYHITIKRVAKKYDIVSISNNEFITSKKLNELGVSKEMMNKFCEDVYKLFKKEKFFTIYNIKNKIDVSWIENIGFDDIFYECLIETIDNLRYLKVNCQKVYSFKEETIKLKNIIEEFMTVKGVYVDDLIDSIRNKYGINISSDKLIYNEYFYSKELNKLYLNKENYYKEVYNYE